MNRKILTLILAFFLFTSLFSVHALGEDTPNEPLVTSGTCGWSGVTNDDNLTWRFENGTLTISGEGEMGLYFASPDRAGERHAAGPWYHLRDSIRAVVIEEGVQSISDFAFAYEYNLETVQIASTVGIIGENAFENCINLKKIALPSVIGIGREAFSGCRKLETVMLSESLRNIGSRAFFLCTSLKEISIPDSVEWAEWGAFQYCNKLEKMYIGNAYEMESWDMYDEYYKTHEGIDSNSLREIQVGPDNQYLKAEDGVLFDKSGEVLIRYPKMKPDKRYTIPEGVKTIREWAFEGCAFLEQVDFPKSLERIGEGAFHGCIGLKGVYIPDGVLIERNLDWENLAYTFKDCVNLRSASVPELVEYMFAGCKSLKNVSIRQAGDQEGYVWPEGAFLNCFSLDRIEISGESNRTILLPTGLDEIGERIIYGYDFKESDTDISDRVLHETAHSEIEEPLPKAECFEYADEKNPYIDIHFDNEGKIFLIHRDGKVTVKFMDEDDIDSWINLKKEVESWTDVKQIENYGYSSAVVGLKLDGTLVYAADEEHPYAYEEVNALAALKLWKDIESIQSDGVILIGMGRDGSVSALSDHGPYDLSEWNDIIDIAFCSWPSDFCVQFIGVTKDGKLREENELLYRYHPWLGDVDHAVSVQRTADLFSGFYVLKEGGTVVVSDRLADIAYELSRWNDIVQIECFIRGESYAAVGLRKDGTVVTTGGLFPETKNWKAVKQLVMSEPWTSILYAVDESGHVLESGSTVSHETWENIEKLYYVAGEGVIGITKDGRVLSDIELF